VQDPGRFLKQLDIAVPCAVAPDAVAVLEDAYLSRLNWELYYFSTAARKTEFDAAPAEHCGLVTDPVVKQRFQPDESSPRLIYNDRTYFFLAQENLTRFKENAETFANPSYPMKRMGQGH
jgi:YHS domain-containing protein